MGIYSSRGIVRGLVDSMALRYLGAWNAPDFRTVSAFRKCHGKALSELFAQCCGCAATLVWRAWGVYGSYGMEFTFTTD